MPSQFFGLNIAYTGLLASNAAMNTTSNNIANGEMERYNNACAAWNNALLTYRDFWCRSHMPRQGVKALRLM